MNKPRKPLRTFDGVIFMRADGRLAAHDFDARRYGNEIHAGSIKDMCRYDVAFVPLDGRPIVAFPRFRIRGGGTRYSRPTLARWSSFLIHLAPMTASPEDWTDRRPQDPTQWVTYRHPRVTYDVYEQVTFEQYFTEVE